MYKHIFIALLSLLLLTGCLSDLDNPVAEGKQYALEAAADVAALDAEQALEIERENQDWLKEKRVEKAEFWASIEKVAQVAGQVLTVVVYVLLMILCFIVARFLTDVLLATAQAYKVFVMIRSRMVPIDRKTGIRQTFFWPSERSLPENSSHDGMNFWKIFKKKHVEPTSWMLVDGATEEHSFMDTEQPASDVKTEVLRQSVLNYQVLMHQVKSAKHSSGGDVAEAMGHSSVELPDAGRMLIEAAKENLG